MPRLLLFAPCDNVLINRQGESASLIVLFTEIKFVEPPVDIPENSLGPMRWFIFAQWEMLAEDVGKTYDQRVNLLNPSGKEMLTLEQEFTGETGKIHHRIVAALPGFPVMGGDGQYRLICSLRLRGSDAWEEKGSYPLAVNHVKEPFMPLI